MKHDRASRSRRSATGSVPEAGQPRHHFDDHRFDLNRRCGSPDPRGSGHRLWSAHLPSRPHVRAVASACGGAGPRHPGPGCGTCRRDRCLRSDTTMTEHGERHPAHVPVGTFRAGKGSLTLCSPSRRGQSAAPTSLSTASGLSVSSNMMTTSARAPIPWRQIAPTVGPARAGAVLGRRHDQSRRWPGRHTP